MKQIKVETVTYNDWCYNGRDRTLEAVIPAGTFDSWLNDYNEGRIAEGEKPDDEGDYDVEEFYVDIPDVPQVYKEMPKDLEIFKLYDDYNGEECVLCIGTIYECQKAMEDWLGLHILDNTEGDYPNYDEKEVEELEQRADWFINGDWENGFDVAGPKYDHYIVMGWMCKHIDDC